jgi:steroid delta-isomerase-like uncharacterized protein
MDMKETDMDEMTTQPLEQLVRRVRSQDLSRGRFIALLTGLGASATGIATLLASAETAGAAGRPTPPAHPHTAAQRHNTHLHETHVRRQGALTHGAAPAPEGGLSADHTQRLQAIVEDYAPDAVVEDPLFAAPIVGKEAIAARKLAEMQGMRGVTIDVTHRFAHHNQVVAEWVLRGRHEGAIFGYPATGRQIEVRGVTVVTREDGKITRESLHYDAADVHRQLSA